MKLARCFILKNSFQYTNVKKVFPLCPPTWPSGTMICTNLNLHYVRKLSCKSELSQLSASQSKKQFQWPRQIFAFLWLSPLWIGPGPSFVLFKIVSIQRWFEPSMIEIGLLVLEIFSNINTSEYGFFLLWPLPEPQGPWFEKTLIYIISEIFHVNMNSSG